MPFFVVVVVVVVVVGFLLLLFFGGVVVIVVVVFFPLNATVNNDCPSCWQVSRFDSLMFRCEWRWVSP